jgi:hypothetical protein
MLPTDKRVVFLDDAREIFAKGTELHRESPREAFFLLTFRRDSGWCGRGGGIVSIFHLPLLLLLLLLLFL